MTTEITKEQYLTALEVVEQYHEQILSNHKLLTKHPIDENFIDFLLLRMPEGKVYQLKKYFKIYKINYVEDINFAEVINIPLMGEKSVAKLDYLIKIYCK